MAENDLTVKMLESLPSSTEEQKQTSKISQFVRDDEFLSNGSLKKVSKEALNILTSGQARALKMLMVACNFLLANGNSLQGPFYPKEAGKKSFL